MGQHTVDLSRLPTGGVPMLTWFCDSVGVPGLRVFLDGGADWSTVDVGPEARDGLVKVAEAMVAGSDAQREAVAGLACVYGEIGDRLAVGDLDSSVDPPLIDTPWGPVGLTGDRVRYWEWFGVLVTDRDVAGRYLSVVGSTLRVVR